MALSFDKGLQSYTVQEAQNASLGQLGSIFLDQSGTSVTPPSGRCIVAITALTDCSFSTLTSDVRGEDNPFINTAGLHLLVEINLMLGHMKYQKVLQSMEDGQQHQYKQLV